MKVLFQDYSFNSSNQQITFNTTDVVKLEQILIITNVTDNIIIYNFADSTKGGTLSNNILTLTFNTTSMSNSDSLQIFLDLNGSPSTETTLTSTNENVILLRRIVQLLTPMAVVDSSQRQRVTVEGSNSFLNNVSTVTSVSNVSSVSSVSTLSGVDVRYLLMDTARTAYANGIRQNLVY